ncbi:MAG: hypothetical protein ABGF52_12315 [Candidatus Asgardarchaeum sp.]
MSSYIDQMVYYVKKVVGYTIIAKSEGIRADEEESFTGRALPTEYHFLKDIPIDNVNKGIGGGFFRVFKLPSDRIAISHVIYKGTDEYGRAVMNAHALVMAEDLYISLSANPYAFVNLFTHPIEETTLPRLSYEETKRQLKVLSPPTKLQNEHCIIVDLFLQIASGKENKVLLVLPNNIPHDKYIEEAFQLIPEDIRASIMLYSFSSDPDVEHGFNFIIVPKKLEITAAFVEKAKIARMDDREYKWSFEYPKKLKIIDSYNALSDFINNYLKYAREKDITYLEDLAEYYINLKEYEKIPPHEISERLEHILMLDSKARELKINNEILRLERVAYQLIRQDKLIESRYYDKDSYIVRKFINEDPNLPNNVLFALQLESDRVRFIFEFYNYIAEENILKLIPQLAKENIRALTKFFEDKNRKLTESILRIHPDEEIAYEYVIRSIKNNLPYSDDIEEIIRRDEFKKGLFDAYIEKRNLEKAMNIAKTVKSEDIKCSMLEKLYELGVIFRNKDITDYALRAIMNMNNDRLSLKVIDLTLERDFLKLLDNNLRRIIREIAIGLRDLTKRKAYIEKIINSYYEIIIFNIRNRSDYKSYVNEMFELLDYVDTSVKEKLVERAISDYLFNIAEMLIQSLPEKKQYSLYKKLAQQCYKLAYNERYKNIHDKLLENSVKYAKLSTDKKFMIDLINDSLKNERDALIIIQNLIDVLSLKALTDILEKAIDKKYPTLIYFIYKELISAKAIGKEDIKKIDFDEINEKIGDYVISSIKKAEKGLIGRTLIELINLIDDELILKEIGFMFLKKGQINIVQENILKKIKSKEIKKEVLRKIIKVNFEKYKKEGNIIQLRQLREDAKRHKLEDLELEILKDLEKRKILAKDELRRYLELIKDEKGDKDLRKELARILDKSKDYLKKGRNQYVEGVLEYLDEHIDEYFDDFVDKIIKAIENILKMRKIFDKSRKKEQIYKTLLGMKLHKIAYKVKAYYDLKKTHEKEKSKFIELFKRK